MGSVKKDPADPFPTQGYFTAGLNNRDPAGNNAVGILGINFAQNTPADIIELELGNPLRGTLLSSDFAPDCLGFDIYYDPENAAFGPPGADGIASHFAAVPSDDNRATTKPIIKCVVDTSNHLQCAWVSSGNGEFWTCNDKLIIVKPGSNPNAIGNPAPQKISLKWTDAVP